jgi:enoyl-CoA hydratase/carnithine racemase
LTTTPSATPSAPTRIAELLGNLDVFARADVGVVVIRSASDEGVWSAGHDVGELPVADLDRSHTASRSRSFFEP